MNRSERRRLEKADKKNTAKSLTEWGEQLEEQIRQEYEKAFQDELINAIDNFCLAIAYSLHFSEKTKFGKNRLNEFMEDLFTTVDMFKKKEYNPDEYKEKLKKDGILMFEKEK